MKKNFYDVNDAGKTLLWCLILPQVLYLVIQIILMAFANGRELEEMMQITPIAIFMTMIAQIGFALVFWRTTKHTSPIPAAKITVKGFGWQNALVCVLIGIVGLFAFNPIANVFAEGLEAIGFKLSEGFLFDISNPFMLILSLVLLAAVPAVVEELVFRGVILQGLRKYGTTKAILITSALFALIHLSAQQLVFPFIFSIVLCYIVIKTNSILASMIVHFVSNAISVVFMYFNISIAIALPMWAYVLIAIASVAAGLAVIWLLTKLLKNTEKPRSAEEVLEAVDNAQKMQTYNSNTYDLKLGITIGVILWAINFVYAFGVV